MRKIVRPGEEAVRIGPNTGPGAARRALLTSSTLLSMLCCRDLPPLHGDLATVLPEGISAASTYSCIGRQDACVRDLGDTTAFFYADSTGLLNTVGVQTRQSTHGGEMIYAKMVEDMTQRYGAPYDCDEEPNGRRQVSRRWKGDHGVLVVLSYTSAGPSDEFPAVIQLTYSTRAKACERVPGVPLPG